MQCHALVWLIPDDSGLTLKFLTKPPLERAVDHSQRQPHRARDTHFESNVANFGIRHRFPICTYHFNKNFLLSSCPARASVRPWLRIPLHSVAGNPAIERSLFESVRYMDTGNPPASSLSQQAVSNSVYDV